MKKTLELVLFCWVLVSVISCSGNNQSETPSGPEKNNLLYNEEFNWTVPMPESFTRVSAEEWARVQGRGNQAMEESMGTPIENNTTTIFVFKAEDLNYFESLHQPFDTATDGNYAQTSREVREMMYHTFLDQMPGTQVDSSSSSTTVGGLDFLVTTMKVTYPNQMVLNIEMYSRLFGNREFAVNLMYTKPELGEKMRKAWLESKFGK